jgi:murein DD-endopeptidase MepM/ murein hydrolase activator NlpD
LSSLYEKGISHKKVVAFEGDFLWPIRDDIRITSTLGPRWGKFHAGLDISAAKGTIIVASMEGRVVKSEYMGGYGNVIIIESRNNFITKYGHNSINLVKEGDFVKKGQIIALVGSSGRSTGPHVHFEIRIKDVPLEPMDFLPEKDVNIVHKMNDNWKINP